MATSRATVPPTDFDTATVDVVTGILEIHAPDGDRAGSPFDEGMLIRRELSPWGIEEYDFQRADDALGEEGYRRINPEWTQSDAPTSEWYCWVERAS